MIGTWKAGGIAVSINPMNQERELDVLLDDSGATVLVCLESLYRDVAAAVVAAAPTSRRSSPPPSSTYQTRDDAARCSPASSASRPTAPSTCSSSLARARRRRRRRRSTLGADDVAFLTYTSGTTGPPKGAMNTHRNVVFNAQAYRDWMRLGRDDVVLGVAPLFHITGLIAHIASALLVGAPLVLVYRLRPGADARRDRAPSRPTFTVGSITVFIALMNAPDADRRRPGQSLDQDLLAAARRSRRARSRRSRTAFGHYIHNIYGLTETTSPSHGVPLGAQAPVDEASGALSVGVPIYNTVVRIVGDDGKDLPPGEVGEFVTTGPQVVAGYWNKPEETANALPGGALHTGDVGFMDADGWFYIVDRKKDQINAGGYKVWPREVEDVLYEHEAVREAAVVGVPDEYRGETVKAFVSLRPGTSVDRGRADRVLQGADGRLQVPAPRRVPRRDPEDRHGQDPAPGAARAGAGRALIDR